MTEHFWLNDPSILFENITNLWPLPKMDFEEKLNAISRLVILLSSLGFLFMKNYKIIISGLVTLVVIALYFKVEISNKNKQKVLENFDNILNEEGSNFTQPIENNPLMNVNLPEIKYNPERKMAAPSFDNEVKKEINNKTLNYIEKNIDNRLLKDVGDSVDFNNSMRNFYSMPSTTIPNNQTAFSNFCYGNMPSCRGGDLEQCKLNNSKSLLIQ
jgi:hypothetical protein